MAKRKILFPELKTYCFHSAESPNGRITIAAYINNEKLHFGTARCNPKDNFCRRAGYKIALERAIKNPSFIVDVKAEESVAKQFINRCLLTISEPISYNFERGSTLYITKERKNQQQAKVIPLRNVHDWDGDIITEEERDEFETLAGKII